MIIKNMRSNLGVKISFWERAVEVAIRTNEPETRGYPAGVICSDIEKRRLKVRPLQPVHQSTCHRSYT
jgi:hypothetical protein